MSFEPMSADDHEERANPNRLSENGQFFAIGAYGVLVLIGFFFGIVTGYEKPAAVVKAPKEKEKEPTKPEPQKPAPAKPTPQPQPEVKKPDPEPEPEPKKVEPKKVEPEPEPKKVEPKKEPEPEPKKVEPKKEPEPAAVAISFEKQVRPILMRYCGNCHGLVGDPKGDVDLRTLAAIINPKNPPILKVGDAKKSALYTTIEDKSMPPKDPRPGKGELELIRLWIDGGAKPRRRKFRR